MTELILVGWRHKANAKVRPVIAYPPRAVVIHKTGSETASSEMEL